MPYITVTKEMSFPELIQWGWDKHTKSTTFYHPHGYWVEFDGAGRVTCNKHMSPNTLFEIGVAEEVTEETEIQNLILMYKDSCTGDINFITYKNNSIKNVLSEIEGINTLAFYMLDDDMTMTLIWKDGEIFDLLDDDY